MSVALQNMVSQDLGAQNLGAQNLARPNLAWKNIGPLDNIPIQGARRLCFGHQGRPVAVFRTADDGVFALVDECPHKRGPLSEGIISGDTVACPLHNWVIGLTDGIALAPDEGRTVSIPVRIVAGEVHVGIPCAVEQAA